MARATDDGRTHSSRSSGGADRPRTRRVKVIGAEVLGYAWATFLVAASGTETLLARLLTKRR
ncbi:MAG TPA: hypothetical protein VLQ65_10235 [Saliniramus sp.]|nr:hypothetical protein [Saliniramus sp.]